MSIYLIAKKQHAKHAARRERQRRGIFYTSTGLIAAGIGIASWFPAAGLVPFVLGCCGMIAITRMWRD